MSHQGVGAGAKFTTSSRAERSVRRYVTVLSLFTERAHFLRSPALRGAPHFTAECAYWISMAPRGAFAAIRRPYVKCEAGRARGGARARTFWSSGGLVRPVKRSPARSVLAHPRRRARTPNGLFGRPRPKVGGAGGMARERRRVAPTHDRTSAAARARACVRRRLFRERPQPGCVERAGAAAWQAAFGAAGFRPPTARLRLRRPSDARSAQRGADASPAARAPQAFERASATACSLPMAPSASACRPPGCV